MSPGVPGAPWTAVRLVVIGPGRSLATQGTHSPLRGPPGVLDPSTTSVRQRALDPCRSVTRPEILRPCRSLVRVKVHGPREIRLDVEK